MTNGEAHGITQMGTAVIRSFAGQPILFGFLIVNLVLLAIIFISVREQRRQTHEVVRYMLEHCVVKAS